MHSIHALLIDKFIESAYRCCHDYGLEPATLPFSLAHDGARTMTHAESNVIIRKPRLVRGFCFLRNGVVGES